MFNYSLNHAIKGICDQRKQENSVPKLGKVILAVFHRSIKGIDHDVTEIDGSFSILFAQQKMQFILKSLPEYNFTV